MLVICENLITMENLIVDFKFYIFSSFVDKIWDSYPGSTYQLRRVEKK